MVKPTSISEEIIASIFRAKGPDVGGVTFRRLPTRLHYVITQKITLSPHVTRQHLQNKVRNLSFTE